MTVQVANNGYGTLAASIAANAGVTSITLSTAPQAATFPQVTTASGNWFYATLFNASVYEIVKVTNISGTTLTVQRAADGTSLQAFNAGDSIECRPVAGVINDMKTDTASAASAAATAQAAATSGAQTASNIHGSTTRGTPNSGDEMAILDSTNSFSLGRITWSTIQSVLTGVMSTLFAAKGANTDLTSVALTNTSTYQSNEIGYRAIPQNIQTGNYTFALADSGEHVLSNNTAGVTFTLPLNATVAFPIGAVITVVNNGTNLITISTTATMYKAGVTTAYASGSTIAQKGLVTFMKIATDTWMVSGAGLS